ncbi:hypothetical protein IM697_24715 [Streptomyces ferrugineus]|uniref:DUF2238 domain-containing protein n=1 Tax=Streptomyces ferrugineus TaxID=1413221 RepID=A0A7M2SCD2_9ACTN|nr:hypothetical protein [Streptomyces ferrugineus]QOV33415.1 hypothetical protein IM697_24715 [Streptomyces ferrugineus]
MVATARSRALRITADGVRLLALASAVAVGIASREGTLLLALLFLALLVPRVARLPALLDLLVCASLTWATWSEVWHWYRVVGWYDTVVHFVTPGAVAAASHLLLSRYRLLPSPDDVGLRRAAVPLTTTAVGAAVACLWEMYEWLAVEVFDEPIRVGYQDTVIDLAAGMGGSLTAGLLLAWCAARGYRAGTAGPGP